MKTLKGSKKEGAIIKETKTWGLHIVDYKTLIGGRATETTCKNIAEAEEKYQAILAKKEIQNFSSWEEFQEFKQQS